MIDEKLSYTEAEVEQLTGLRIKTLQRWRYEKRGPRFVRCGRCVRYPAADLRRRLNSQAGGGMQSGVGKGRPMTADLIEQRRLKRSEVSK
jgi:hypothetical protein